MMNYIENGNIKNSVNFPAVNMGLCCVASCIGILHQNTPNMIDSITSAISELNISKPPNHSRNQYTYTLLDLNLPITEQVIQHLKTVDDIISVRFMKG